jgi:hypothetical protein
MSHDYFSCPDATVMILPMTDDLVPRVRAGALG